MTSFGKILAIGLSAALIGVPGIALAADGGSHLFFEGDMVVSPPKGAPGPHCVLASQFNHNERVVWRVRVLDQDGNPVTDQDVTGLEVKLSSGETFQMKYGGHPHSEPADFFWSSGWTVPAEYPAGSLSYTVTATTTSGTTQTWSPFNVALSQLTVLEGTTVGTE